jgi:hypothetical protein
MPCRAARSTNWAACERTCCSVAGGRCGGSASGWLTPPVYWYRPPPGRRRRRTAHKQRNRACRCRSVPGSSLRAARSELLLRYGYPTTPTRSSVDRFGRPPTARGRIRHTATTQRGRGHNDLDLRVWDSSHMGPGAVPSGPPGRERLTSHCYPPERSRLRTYCDRGPADSQVDSHHPPTGRHSLAHRCTISAGRYHSCPGRRVAWLAWHARGQGSNPLSSTGPGRRPDSKSSERLVGPTGRSLG